MNYFKEDPPFPLGETLKGTQTIDGTTSTINETVLGTRCAFEHVDYSISGLTAGRARLSGKPICAIALRNTSGITLLPKRLVRLDTTAGLGRIKNADGYTVLLAGLPAVLVDPWLPSAGVADDDIFWGIYQGPALVLTPTAGADLNGDIAAGAPLVAATGSTSGNSTGGRVSNITMAAQTAATVSYSMAKNFIGHALSARTTGETAANLLVDFDVRI